MHQVQITAQIIIAFIYAIILIGAGNTTLAGKENKASFICILSVVILLYLSGTFSRFLPMLF